MSSISRPRAHRSGSIGSGSSRGKHFGAGLQANPHVSDMGASRFGGTSPTLDGVSGALGNT